MISEIIADDIKDEFEILRKDIKVHLTGDYDISASKIFLKNYISSEILNKSELLLDTLLNYLMGEALKRMEKADIEIQNEFFKQDFRNKVRAWAKKTENTLRINPEQIIFSKDPRWQQGIISSGLTFIIGTTVTVLIYYPTKVIAAIVAGLLTIIVSTIAFKIRYENASPLARNQIAVDVDNYLAEAEKQINKWLESVIDVYAQEYESFCRSKGFTSEDKIK